VLVLFHPNSVPNGPSSTVRLAARHGNARIVLCHAGGTTLAVDIWAHARSRRSAVQLDIWSVADLLMTCRARSIRSS